MTKPRVITHNGSFQIDELMAVATLQILLGDIEVVRTRDPEIIKGGDYVVDVGLLHDPARNLFDHHQRGGAGARANGVPYSSFGLVWQTYGSKVASSEAVAKIVDERLVQPIDALDNGVTLEKLVGPVHGYYLHNAVFAFRATWKEAPEHMDAGFMKMLVFAREILEREIVHARDYIEACETVSKIYAETADKRVIVIDQPYPAGEILSRFKEPLYVVKPKKQGSDWEIEAVRSDLASFENRKPLPENWAGKTGADLAQETGVSDAVFCHNKRFVAGARSKEGAIALAALALKS